jgi:hypothetical protein
VRGAAPLALIALAAFGIRLLYIYVIAPAPTGIGGDAGFYSSAASQLADGHFYYRVIFGHAYPTAEHPPLYPIVLAVPAVLGAKSLIAYRIVSCAIGSVAVALIGVLGRRLAGNGAGIAAAAIAALYPPFVTSDGLVMSEPLFTLLVAAALIAALAVRARPTVARAAGLGLVIGLASLTRAEALLLVPLLAWPAVRTRRAPGAATRAAVATLVAVAVLAPWVIRNAVVFHRFILATDSNTLIAGANCPAAYYGHDIGWWNYDCFVRVRTKAQVHEGDASTAKAFDYAGDHVGRLPLVALTRVARTFDFFQPLRQGNREPRRKWVDVAGLAFYYPLLILAGLGLAAIRRNRAILLAPVFMVIVVSALGWGIGRFRIAADVSIVALAAAAMVHLAHCRRRSGELALPLRCHVQGSKPMAASPGSSASGKGSPIV